MLMPAMKNDCRIQLGLHEVVSEAGQVHLLPYDITTGQEIKGLKEFTINATINGVVMITVTTFLYGDFSNGLAGTDKTKA